MDIEEAREIMYLRGLYDVSKIFSICNAYWIYQGLPGEPHALLTAGGHSDGYFNVNEVTKYANFRKILAEMMVMKLELAGIENIDVVVSSTYAATSIGQEIADCLDAIFVFTEKDGDNQKWSGRFEIPSGARGLQVEELITTLSTTEQVEKAVLPEMEFIRRQGKVVVATIIHRPAKLPIEYDTHIVVPLWEVEVHNWPPEKCPLCAGGSKALKPKPNWPKFQEYIKT